MADERESIYFEIKLDLDAAQKGLKDIKAELVALDSQMATLQKNLNAGTINSEAFGKQMQTLKTQQAAATEGLKVHTKTLDDHQKVEAQAQASNAKMHTQLDAMTASFSRSAMAEAEATKRTKALSDEQLQLEQSTARSGRETGNLSKGLTTLRDAFANNGAKLFGAQIQQFDGLFGKFKGGLDLIKTGMAGLRPAGETAKIGFDTVRVGIASTGIGLLLLALTSLITYFTETAEGARLVKAATAALGAVFQTVKDVVTGVGKSLVEAFTHPLAFIDRLNQALAHPIDTLRSLGASILAFGHNVTTAASSAYELVGLQKTLVKERRELEIQDVQERSRVEVLLRLSKDRSKSVSDRQKLLVEAGKVEQDITAKNLALQEKELANLQLEIKLKGQSKDVGDLKQAEADKRKEIAQTKATQDQTLASIAAREGRFRTEEAALNKAAAEQAKALRKEAALELVAESERALLLAKQKGEETLSLEVLLIKRRRDAELIDAKGKGARALIAAKAEADIVKAKTEAAIQNDTLLYTTQESKVQARLSLAEKGSKQELDLQQKLLTIQLDKAKANAVDTLTNKKELTAKLRELDADYTSKSEALDRSFATTQANQQAELGNLRLETEVNLNEKSKANLRKQQADRIELERTNALDLLKTQVLTADQRTAKENDIEAKAIAQRKDLAKQLRVDGRTDDLADIEKGLAESKEGSDKEFQLKIAKLHNLRDAELDNEEQTEKQKAEIRAKYKRQEDDLDDEHGKKKFEKILDQVEKYTQALGTIQEAQIQAQSKALDKEQANALKSAGLSAEIRGDIEENYARKRETLERNAAERRRKIATVENLISVARGVTDAITKNAGDPILQVIETALVVATGVEQQQVISSQKFEFGGVVNGPSHAAGGVKFNVGGRGVELEGGEAVINRRSTAMHLDLLSKINQAGGGRAFSGATQSQVPKFSHYSLGGMLPSPQSSGIGLSLNDVELAMSNAVRKMNFPQQVVYVSDIQTKGAQVVKVASKADI